VIVSRKNTQYLTGDAEPVDLSRLSTEPKKSSSFFTEKMRKRAGDNIAQLPGIRKAADELIAKAKPWMRMSNDQLWGLMFAPSIPRSWMVWSNGHCPACHKSVPMYEWKINALKKPWKLACPHCEERFPKNDFYAFFKSGLDEHGLFDPQRADRNLLFNSERPDTADPLHNFGVDDGTGYVEGDKKWRFIGAYLIYGQWKQVVLGGINALAAAYVLSGDRLAARKAAIMIDRVADVYPDFSFKDQGEVYEVKNPFNNGYVSSAASCQTETYPLLNGFFTS